MITRVPVSISMGTRGTRELLMSLLVESLDSALFDNALVLGTLKRSEPLTSLFY